jgi:hypothetical protein
MGGSQFCEGILIGELISTIEGVYNLLPCHVKNLAAGPSGPTGWENGAQGRGRRPMPWVEKGQHGAAWKAARPFGPALEGRGWEAHRSSSSEMADDVAQRLGPCEKKQGVQVLAALQAARLGRLFSQGVGLRPRPWAGVSRPVGPVGRFPTGC